MITIKELDRSKKTDVDFVVSNLIKLVDYSCKDRFWDKKLYKRITEDNFRNVYKNPFKGLVHTHIDYIIKPYLIKYNEENIGSFIIQISQVIALKNHSGVYLIHSLYICDNYQKRGYGTQAMKKVFEKVLIENGIVTYEIEVDIGNKPAINFWNSLGFEIFRHRMVKINF
jgi:predicted acetyltransferase